MFHIYLIHYDNDIYNIISILKLFYIFYISISLFDILHQRILNNGHLFKKRTNNKYYKIKFLSLVILLIFETYFLYLSNICLLTYVSNFINLKNSLSILFNSFVETPATFA